MRIGIDARLLGNKHGGIGRYTFELVRGILETDNENEYWVFYNNDSSKEVAELRDTVNSRPRNLGNSENVRLVETNIRHYSIAEQVRLPRILEKYNLDLVHFTNFNAPILYKKPFVVTIHDVVHHKIGGAKRSHLLHFYAYKKVIENAARNSRAIITVSEFSKRDIGATLHVPQEKIYCIYEGTNLPVGRSDEKIEEVKNTYLLKSPYFLFVGVLERKKNVVNLTRGFDEFIRKYRLDMDLVIVGKADKHYPDIRHHAADIKNKERLIFTGYVEDADLVALYEGAYAFTSASLHEGFGLPGVEAMKYGVPLVVSNIEVFNEVYENAAIYFDANDVSDIADKLYLMARDPQFRQQLAEKAIARSELFDWKRTAEETIKIYQNILTS